MLEYLDDKTSFQNRNVTNERTNEICECENISIYSGSRNLNVYIVFSRTNYRRLVSAMSDLYGSHTQKHTHAHVFPMPKMDVTQAIQMRRAANRML